MRKVEMIFSMFLLGLTIAGCGDLTVNQPARPTVIIEEKRTKPVIIEKTTVEKPVIVIEKH